MKTGVVLSLFFMILGMNAEASTFENVRGVYKVLSCKNESRNPSSGDSKLCINRQITIHPEVFGTTIYFSQPQATESIRSFGLPQNMGQLPHGKYVEKGDYYASFTNDQYGYGEVLIVRKVSGEQFHLSIHRRSDAAKTLDLFEIEAERTSKTSDTLQSRSVTYMY